VVASHIQFDQTTTIVAALPSILPSSLEHLLKACVCRAVSIVLVLLAKSASNSSTRRANSLLASNVLRANERRADRIGAIYSIQSIELNLLCFISGKEIVSQEDAHSSAGGDWIMAASRWKE
jgi:hypothetical protein